MQLQCIATIKDVMCNHEAKAFFATTDTSGLKTYTLEMVDKPHPFAGWIKITHIRSRKCTYVPMQNVAYAIPEVEVAAPVEKKVTANV